MKMQYPGGSKAEKFRGSHERKLNAHQKLRIAVIEALHALQRDSESANKENLLNLSCASKNKKQK